MGKQAVQTQSNFDNDGVHPVPQSQVFFLCSVHSKIPNVSLEETFNTLHEKLGAKLKQLNL